MNNRILTLLLLAALPCGVIADYFYGMAEVGRLSFFGYLILSLLYFACLMIPPEELFKKYKGSLIGKTLSVSSFLILVFCGWTFTAILWGSSIGLCWVKRINWQQKSAKSSAEDNSLEG